MSKRGVILTKPEHKYPSLAVTKVHCTTAHVAFVTATIPPSITKSPHQYSAFASETPPTRVWGIRKTRFLYLPAERKHTHACGEDCLASLRWLQILETPPRIWGKPLPHKSDTSNYRNTPQLCGESASNVSKKGHRPRNTPTCVGKTSWENNCNNTAKKHPHACEEDLTVLSVEACPKETPPIMWGRLNLFLSAFAALRNTPTYLGKTKRPQQCSYIN